MLSIYSGVKNAIKNKTFVMLSSMLLFLATNFSAYSQNGWIYETEYPTSSTLLGVKFITPSKGWAVGTSGTIIYTEDGGVNWELQDSGTNQDLKAVAFVNEKVGWVVGNGGTIIHTMDGGKNWVKQESANFHLRKAARQRNEMVSLGSEKIDIHKVFFLDEKEGWIGGDDGALLHTLDGGDSWESKKIYTKLADCGHLLHQPSVGMGIGGRTGLQDNKWRQGVEFDMAANA